MDKSGLAQTLRALAADFPRSDTAKLREVFEDVQSAISLGVPRKNVHEALLSHGFTFSLQAFDNAMTRIRKRRRQADDAAKRPKPQTEQSGRTALTSKTLVPGTSATPVVTEVSSEPLVGNMSNSGSERPQRIGKPAKFEYQPATAEAISEIWGQK